jgi:MFS family permease
MTVAIIPDQRSSQILDDHDTVIIMKTRDKRWVALAVVCLGQLMMILDATIVAVALPAMKTDLGFSSSSLTWVPNAYLIAFGSFLLLGGRLGDLIGRRRMFLAGIAIFTGASLLCGFAGSEAMLIGARFVQGFGAAVGASAI